MVRVLVLHLCDSGSNPMVGSFFFFFFGFFFCFFACHEFVTRLTREFKAGLF